MNRRRGRNLAGGSVGGLLVSSLLWILPGIQPGILSARAQQEQFPEGPGKEIFLRVCTQCHEIDSVASLRHTKDGWRDLVYTMQGNGANATDDECNAIVDYLARNFGKEEPRVNVNKAGAAELETGLSLTAEEAKAIVAYRVQKGEFKEWNDLLKVAGVDAKKLEAAKTRIEFQ
ncbi:MAG: hypothetical protein A3J28_01185 [Acidobacteria bacterium RIFCSPLOWO2_12_FULL_60_22]|nr:MAG: hypothetical protein A3J28_01185 [Acidobacteria bacterium RIFCSPLOWO2_12_FULL_60_22]